MTAQFSGEQKLRIVLESIIRNVPKSEQSIKYGISEDEFQKWHDHLIENGGKIFELSNSITRNSSRKRKMSPMAKFFMTLSLLTNLGLIVFGIVYVFHISEKDDDVQFNDKLNNPIDSPIHITDKKDDKAEKKVAVESDPLIETLLQNSSDPNIQNGNTENIESLLANPKELTEPRILGPLEMGEPSNEVIFNNRTYEGRHVVYLLDVGTYLLEDNQSIQQFQKAKEELISSIVSLSPNSYFNLVLYWNLRDAAALGKTILKSSQENKKYAIDWITSLGITKDSLKTDRNQYYPKELLYAKPNIGIVGPWYGLSTAISYDPDIVFILAGNMPNFDRNEIPRAHFQGLGKIDFSSLNNPNSFSVDPLGIETAKKWYYAVTSIDSLPSNESEVEKIALARLGLLSEGQAIPVQLSWDKAFENFLSSLEVGFDRIPQTHFFLNLPKYASWPSPLLNSAKEFAETSRGSFQENSFLP